MFLKASQKVVSKYITNKQRNNNFFFCYINSINTALQSARNEQDLQSIYANINELQPSPAKDGAVHSPQDDLYENTSVRYGRVDTCAHVCYRSCIYKRLYSCILY